MNRAYFLYVYDFSGGFYFPYKIYHSHSYVLNLCRSKNVKKFKLERLDKYNSFRYDLIEYYEDNVLIRREKMDNITEFYDYLRSVGYNENGANEVIRRLEESRPDREDLYYLNQYSDLKRR